MTGARRMPAMDPHCFGVQKLFFWASNPLKIPEHLDMLQNGEIS